MTVKVLHFSGQCRTEDRKKKKNCCTARNKHIGEKDTNITAEVLFMVT